MSSSSREVMLPVHTTAPGWAGKTHRDTSVGAAIPELAVISPAGVSSWEFSSFFVLISKIPFPFPMGMLSLDAQLQTSSPAQIFNFFFLFPQFTFLQD